MEKNHITTVTTNSSLRQGQGGSMWLTYH